MSKIARLIEHITNFFAQKEECKQENLNVPPLESISEDSYINDHPLETLDVSSIERENNVIKTEIEQTLGAAERSDGSEVENGSLKEDEVKTDEDQDIADPVIIDKDWQAWYSKLLEDCIDIIKELDAYNRTAGSDEAKLITETIPFRLIEAIANGPIEIIDCDKEFDVRLHTPLPAKPVAKDTPIIEFIRPGVKVGNRVLLRAIVRV